MCPGVLEKKISTQQSTWMEMEDGNGAVVALKDHGGGAAALGGVVGRWFEIAAVALGGSGGRRTCDDGIGISVIKAEGLVL